MSAELQRRGIQSLSLAYYGRVDLSRHGLLNYRVLYPYELATGWVAISQTLFRIGEGKPPDRGFAWLEAYRPVTLVGRSIRLYYISP